MDQQIGLTSWLAPAKINLALHVTGRRADGYHLLESLAVFTRFGDRIEATLADADAFVVTGRYAQDVPLDADNLVLRARDALRSRAGTQAGPVRIVLEKNLPVASGVGGAPAMLAVALASAPIANPPPRLPINVALDQLVLLAPVRLANSPGAPGAGFASSLTAC